MALKPEGTNVAVVGSKRKCEWPGCPAEMTLKAKRPAIGRSYPQQVEHGTAIPETKRLLAWICGLNPRRHVLVEGWGMRPTRDCTEKDCGGVMVHADKGRAIVPEDLTRYGGVYPRLGWEPGFVCLENETHFFADEQVARE